MLDFVTWNEGGKAVSARWLSESGAPAPTRIVIADDEMSADEAYGLACQGTALLWRGDFHNARQMLRALASRAERRSSRKPKKPSAVPAADATASAEAFHLHRQARAQRARTLNALLVPLEADYTIPLRRAPDIRVACASAFGGPAAAENSLVSLQSLLGVIGAHEWRIKGIDVPAAGGRIHPHYGVFAPIRSEYIDLVATAPLPATCPKDGVVFDIGTGTGVLAAVLVKRGVHRVIATDQDPRALACARENIGRLGLTRQIDVVQANLFPAGRAALIVCNPPWLPARPSSAIERAIYDPDSEMLRGFLNGLPEHLEPGGEGWLILSDLAEHLGLRSRADLLAAFDTAGLKVLDRIDIRPKHPRAADMTDALHAARAAEVTSLWRLTVR